MNKKLITMFFSLRYETPYSYIACSDNLISSIYRLKRDCEDTISWLENRTGDAWKDYQLREDINKSIGFLITEKKPEYYKELLEKINSDILEIHNYVKYDEDLSEFIYKELEK